ncbi:MAG: peptidase, partial [Bacteroidetes bacterium RIFOXYC12_FULL_35_7]
MKPKNSILMLLALASIIFASCQGEKKTDEGNKNEIPLEDFFKNPEKSGFQISPDGKYISYLAEYEKRMNIFVRETGKTEAVRITSEKERDISGYFWANNNRILFLKDAGGDENFKLFGVDTDGKNLKALTDFPSVRTQILDPLEEIPDEVIIGLNKRNPQAFDAYRLNIVTGDTVMIAKNPGNIQGWLTDHNGKLRIAIATDGVNQIMLYRKTEKDEFKPVLVTSFKEQVSPEFFTFDNKNLIANSNLGRDKSAAVEFNPETGKEVKVLYENPDYDLSNVAYSKKRKCIISAVYTSWKRERHFFDKEFETLYNKIKDKFPGYDVGIVDMTKEEDKYIVATFSDKMQGVYYLYDVATDKVEKLAEVTPWLKEEKMAEMKPVEYQSRDGLKIPGYLTLPKGVEAKNLPVIINVHGGPWHRDSWGYNPEVQFLASRGYAVLQINFRGSTGYGRKFWEASFKQWGKNMQNDISDGVEWLIKEGIADSKKVCIYGASYGGYATLAGLTFTPDLYACGVDYVGVSNLFTFMKT